MAVWRPVWAGASSCLAALALLFASACDEPLAPPHPGDKPYHQAPARDAAVARVVSPADAQVVVAIDAAAIAIDAPPSAPEVPAAPGYSAIDALADAKASPLTYVGIGAWPGNYSIKGCVYKNDRVFVVDVYCTYKEQVAFSVVIVNPDKGEVRIYAEAEKPISTITRAEYFTFEVDSFPPGEGPAVPALKTATFQQVADYTQNVYNARIAMPGMGTAEVPANGDFVREPPDDWTWIID